MVVSVENILPQIAIQALQLRRVPFSHDHTSVFSVLIRLRLPSIVADGGQASQMGWIHSAST